MREQRRIIIFAIAVIAAFTLFSRYYIPQVTPAPPPEEIEVELAEMTTEEIVSLGKYVYNVKGSCRKCHGTVGSRAPGLSGIAADAGKRLSHPAYGGRAESAAAYILESMIEPSAYVVPGYGVKGSGDRKSPMPEATGRAVGLSEAEIISVIAYLQSIAGVEVRAVRPALKEAPGEIDETP